MTGANKNWLALDVTVEAQATEAAEFAFNEIGALGTEINLLGIKQMQAAICVTGYFNEKPDEENLRFQISNSLRIYGFGINALKSIEWRKVENRDWLEEWKKHWKPTEVGNFIIAPPWEEVDEPEKIVISIEPNMAFGTGTHETTRLCLQAIEDNYTPGQSFLDVGTGTGILTIAAAKLNLRYKISNRKISACDTDEDSIKIARENAELNGIDNIEFFIGSVSTDMPLFDFVCANLTLDVIVPILPLLVQKSKETLVLSGILREQEESIVAELRKFEITNYRIDRDGEWISVAAVERGL